MADTQEVFAFPDLNVEVYLFRGLTREFPPHFHNCLLGGMLLAGSRILRYGNKERVIGPGELVILPPFVNHACQPLGRSSCDWLCLHMKSSAPRTHQFEPLFEIDAIISEKYQTCATMLRKGNSSIFELVPGLQAEIFALLAKRGRLERIEPSFQMLRAVLEQRCHEAISLKDMAKLAVLSKYHFARKFTQATGISPYRYLESARLALSQELLRGGAALADCAATSGYYDQSHFNRCFRANLGVTPGLYRKQWAARQC